MNVGDWVEIDTGFLKGSLARITLISSQGYISVVTTDYQQGTYFGEGCFKQKPTTPNKEYEDLFL